MPHSGHHEKTNSPYSLCLPSIINNYRQRFINKHFKLFTAFFCFIYHCHLNSTFFSPTPSSWQLTFTSYRRRASGNTTGSTGNCLWVKQGMITPQMERAFALSIVFISADNERSQTQKQRRLQQESIPVGCVPSASRVCVLPMGCASRGM